MGSGKYKGERRYAPHEGLGRLRRANRSDPRRLAGLERMAEDDQFLDRLEQRGRVSHSGESLLARFNRAARERAEEGGEPGAVCGFAGKLVTVRDAAGREHACEMRQGLKKRVAGVTAPLAVGDRVRILPGSDTGAPVIVAILPRTNQLARADSHNRAFEDVLAANVDRMVIVASVGEPAFKPALVDRYLVIAHHNDIAPALVVNKGDLGDAAEPARLYRGLGYDVFCTDAAHGSGDIDALRAHLKGLTSVVTGQSGVGKSSLLNALHPGLGARVGAISQQTGHGRHTTTAARSYPLPDGGAVVDTPGIRECAISGMTPLDVALLYRDIARFHRACHFADCTHLHEPDCAVREAVERGEIAVSRYASYMQILEEDLAG